MDNQPTLGHLLHGNEERDAIHVAIFPAIAAEDMDPGSHVEIVDPAIKFPLVGPTRGKNPIGIIDPFLTMQVKRDQCCYVLLYPRTVTGMRHEWSHPAFDEISRAQDAMVVEGLTDDSRQWLEEFARSCGSHWDGSTADVESLIRVAKEYVNTGIEGFAGGDSFGAQNNFPDDNPDEFWKHFTNVTGIHVPDERKGNPFDCAC